jgi:hypothetical protein
MHCRPRGRLSYCPVTPSPPGYLGRPGLGAQAGLPFLTGPLGHRAISDRQTTGLPAAYCPPPRRPDAYSRTLCPGRARLAAADARSVRAELLPDANQGTDQACHGRDATARSGILRPYR